MRPRFSLRTFLLLLALLACFCYIWLARPTQLAQRFADAVDRGDYRRADQLLGSEQPLLAGWAEKRWAFDADCRLRPRTIADWLSARRSVDVHLRFFEFDSSAGQHIHTVATPFRLQSPTVSPISYGDRFIDSARSRSLDEAVPRR